VKFSHLPIVKERRYINPNNMLKMYENIVDNNIKNTDIQKFVKAQDLSMRRGVNSKRAREYDCYQAVNRISTKIDSKISDFIESYRFKKPLKGSIKTECNSSIQHSGSPN